MIQRIRKLLKKKNFSLDYIVIETGLGKTLISTIKGKKDDVEIKNVEFIKWLFKEFPNLNPIWLFWGEGEMWLDKNKEPINLDEYVKRSELEGIKKDIDRIEYLFKNLIDGNSER